LFSRIASVVYSVTPSHIVAEDEGNSEKVGIAAAQGCTARKSITHVIDSAIASSGMYRTRDH
jgi:hypothetical protein